MKLASQIISELRKSSFPKNPVYEKIMKHVLKSYNPVFSQDSFSKKYSELSRNGEWFANSLIANACMEGYGSQQIWNFANKLDNDTHADAVRKHALDESRHATMFITIFDLTFPGVRGGLDIDTNTKIEQMQPRFSKHEHPPICKAPEQERFFEIASIQELIQVHITEIRALVLQYMVRNALLQHAPDHHRSRLMKMSDTLIRDEARHINYSAAIFEHYALENTEEFHFMFDRCMCDFNELTKEELERENLDL